MVSLMFISVHLSFGSDSQWGELDPCPLLPSPAEGPVPLLGVIAPWASGGGGTWPICAPLSVFSRRLPGPADPELYISAFPLL